MASRGVADPRFEDRGWVAGIASPGSLGGFIWDIWISLIDKKYNKVVISGHDSGSGACFFLGWLVGDTRMVLGDKCFCSQVEEKTNTMEQ